MSISSTEINPGWCEGLIGPILHLCFTCYDSKSTSLSNSIITIMTKIVMLTRLPLYGIHWIEWMHFCGENSPLSKVQLPGFYNPILRLIAFPSGAGRDHLNCPPTLLSPPASQPLEWVVTRCKHIGAFELHCDAIQLKVYAWDWTWKIWKVIVFFVWLLPGWLWMVKI